MSNVHVFDHPLIQHKLSILRDKNTSVKEFRELISEIAMLMCFEATRDLPLEEIDVETPVATAHCKHIAGKKLAIVPILRAGLGMVDGMVTMMPNVKVGHIGLFRDPQTLEPVKYYFKMPPDIAERDVIIVDPMLATGGSASAAVQFMKEVGCKHIKLMCIIGAPEGVAVMQKEHPDVDIYVAALDDHLNEHGYIVPGLATPATASSAPSNSLLLIRKANTRYWRANTGCFFVFLLQVQVLAQHAVREEEEAHAKRQRAHTRTAEHGPERLQHGHRVDGRGGWPVERAEDQRQHDARADPEHEEEHDGHESFVFLEALADCHGGVGHQA